MIISAYDGLNSNEREVVDAYVNSVKIYAEQNNELILHSLSRPIPEDVIARSRGVLEKPLVKAAIYDRIKELSDEEDLSAKRVMREHMNLAMSNMADYLKFEDSGFMKIELSQCTRKQLAAVKKVKVEHGIFGTQVTIELHDKNAHLQALNKMMGLDQADNSTYLKHISNTKEIKPLEITATPEASERAYVELLEGIR